MIERDIPGIGGVSLVELCGALRASNQAPHKIGSARIQWQHSCVARDKTFCIYLVDSEASALEHSELNGIPVANVMEISQIIDPTMAND